MSGDLIYVQCPVVVNEFIENVKFLSVSQSPKICADAIEQLNIQLKCAIPNGLKENKQFALIIIDNLYRVVPLFDMILTNDIEDDNNCLHQVTSFLETLSNAFDQLCLFDVMRVVKDTARLQIIFQNYIVLLKESYFTDNKKYDNLVTCLIPIIGFSSLLIPIHEDKIPANLLTYFLTFVKRYWRSEDRGRIIKNILGVIKCFCKKPTLVPLVIRTEWPQACIQWLTTPGLINGSRPSHIVDYIIYLILQKLARHTIGVEVLNQLNCLKAIDESKGQMEKDHPETHHTNFQFLQCMIYALLTETNEIKQTSVLTDRRMCQVLKQLVTYTIQASRDENFFHGYFHISEMLSVLCKLFNNDDILLGCLNERNELFDCLCQLVIHFATITSDITRLPQPIDDETLLSLTNLLWSISFHQCFHEKFQTNTMLMHTLSSLATSSSLYTGAQTKSIPRDLCSLKKAAEGILWNLKSLSSHVVPTITNEKTESQPLAMISYSHSDASFCRELVEHLSVHVPVWVDYKQAHNALAHSDDLWEEIARAMEMASIIILIVSKEYYDSKSCRQELSYASDTIKKRIVPVYAPNQQYRASGWLGIRIAGQKYIHFGRKLFSDGIKELAAMFVTDQKLIIPSLLTPPSTPTSCSLPETIPKKIIEEETKLLKLNNWKKNDIRKWFDDNHIQNDLITLYGDQFQTGTALLVYARHLNLFYRNEYVRIYAKYYKLFDGKRLDTFDFITFVDALNRLRIEYNSNYNAEDNYDKCVENQLQGKIKTLDEGMTWL